MPRAGAVVEPGMSSEPTTGDLATRKALEVRRELEAALPDDPEGQERAFGNAVRAAWVRGEPWAVQWVERATGGAVGGP